MGISETRNRDTDEMMTSVVGGASAGCNSHSHTPLNRLMARDETQELLGQLSRMLPQLERSLRS